MPPNCLFFAARTLPRPPGTHHTWAPTQPRAVPATTRQWGGELRCWGTWSLQRGAPRFFAWGCLPQACLGACLRASLHRLYKLAASSPKAEPDSSLSAPGLRRHVSDWEHLWHHRHLRHWRWPVWLRHQFYERNVPLPAHMCCFLSADPHTACPHSNTAATSTKGLPMPTMQMVALVPRPTCKVVLPLPCPVVPSVVLSSPATSPISLAAKVPSRSAPSSGS